ncbi:MAG TPA: AAA family ATPase [Acidobacteriaceae bacterium]
MLRKITLLRERVADWDSYPFRVPVIRRLESLELRSQVTFFAGENGSGKSTLLEAIAAHYGFGREGGTRSFGNNSTESNLSIEPLVKALRLSFDVRTGAGFFLRAESLFNLANWIDDSDRESAGMKGEPISSYYGGRSLHTRSHGETFFTIMDLKMQRGGLFLLDEPEAALSPQRQLAFLVLMHETVKAHKDAQFILSTHSPLLLGYPGAQIFSFDDAQLREIGYEETAPVQIVRRFVNDRERFTEELFAETPSLFDAGEAKEDRSC